VGLLGVAQPLENTSGKVGEMGVAVALRDGSPQRHLQVLKGSAAQEVGDGEATVKELHLRV
jgi:hypothetical protein